MNTELISLEAELEILKEAQRVSYDKQVQRLDSILNKWFVEKYENARCLRRWFRQDYFDGMIVCAEIGFYNVNEDRIDFASDFSIDFSTDKGELRINHGCCGYFSKKEVYQFRRAKIISDIFENIKEIESDLNEFCADVSPEFITFENDVYDLEHKISKIKSDMVAKEKDNIDKQLVVGSSLYYAADSNIRVCDKMFGGKPTIIKVTPKFLTLACDSVRFKLRRSEVVDHVYKKYLVLSPEVKENL